MNARQQAKRTFLSPKFEIECGIVIYKLKSLSIMQLLSVLFKCKIYYLCTYLIIILEFSNQFWDFFWSTHSLFFFFNSQNLSESHYYGNPFFQLPRSLPKSLTRLPFYLYMYLNQLLSQFLADFRDFFTKMWVFFM